MTERSFSVLLGQVLKGGDMKKLMTFILGSLLVLNLCGCFALVAGTIGGAGTAGWLSGKLVQQVNASYEGAIEGAKFALKAMNLVVSKEVKASDVTQIRSHYTDGRKIWIDIRPITATSTRIEIRVGAFGDKAASDTVLKKIISFL